jgi:hypothetical protein
MSQSEWIGAILIAGFILWLAITQRLSAYWSILLGGGAAPPPPQASGGTSTAPQIGTATGDAHDQQSFAMAAKELPGFQQAGAGP